MLTKADLEALSNLRLDDAVLLVNAGRASSAYYLAGYAVECALKACIAKLFQPNAIPDKVLVSAIYTHKLGELMNIAALTGQLNADSKTDPKLGAAWGIASKWTETSRYELCDIVTAATLVEAIANPGHGVFQWVKKHW